MTERTLALAGLFQATELVRQAANHGTWSGYAASSSLQSLFKLEAATTADIFGGTPKVRLGIETLLAVLQGDNQYTDSLRYAVGLLQIEKKFRRAGKAAPGYTRAAGRHRPTIHDVPNPLPSR